MYLDSLSPLVRQDLADQLIAPTIPRSLDAAFSARKQGLMEFQTGVSSLKSDHRKPHIFTQSDPLKQPVLVQGYDTIGDDIIVNGGFSQGATGWESQGVVTFSGGLCTILSPNNEPSIVFQRNLDPNKTYKVVFDIPAIRSGRLVINHYSANFFDEAGTNFEYVFTGETVLSFKRGIAGTDLDIDNVRCYEVSLNNRKNYLQFDGVNDSLSADQDLINTAGDFTLMWKATANAGAMYFSPDITYGYIYLPYNNKLSVRGDDLAPAVISIFTLPTALEEGKAYSFCLVRKNNELSLYIDDALIETITHIEHISFQHLGYRGNNDSGHFKGKFYGCRVHPNKALSLREIKQELKEL